jgi:hypothetical protein
MYEKVYGIAESTTSIIMREFYSTIKKGIIESTTSIIMRKFYSTIKNSQNHW